MDKRVLLVLASLAISSSSAWSVPYYSVPRAPMRVTRYAIPPNHGPLHHGPAPPRVRRVPVQEPVSSHDEDTPKWQRPKRGHDHDHDYDHDDHRPTSGVTGPVHTFVKTDKNANYKWGVRHHVGNKFAS